MERLAATEDGRVEIVGRWFGVRGRRFMRPALTLTLGEDGPDRRWLAELEHKPWEAQDGEPWTAVFPVDIPLDSASAIELAVAPDIEITVRAPADAGDPAHPRSVAAQSRSPMAKQDAPGRRPSARAQDLERLAARLASAEAALERERERRAAVDQALEEQRAESRRLSAELGRARAELDLAQTVAREGDAVSDELESTRHELRALEHRHAQLVTEHHREVEAHARLEAALRERSGALESARDALEQERSRDVPEPAREERRRERERSRDSERTAVARPIERPAAPRRVERTTNPALRTRPNWAGRVLALLVIIAVVVAVWLVLHSTILH